MILFLDIETTGLTADNYQITCVATTTGRKAEHKTLVWFAAKLNDDKRLIEHLKTSFSICKQIVVWRDKDIPFIQTRALVHGIEFPINVPVLDLSIVVRDKLLFSQKRFRDIMAFLEIPRTDRFDGSQMPTFYFEYEGGNLGRKDDIINHCRDDVENLAELYEKLKRMRLVE